MEHDLILSQTDGRPMYLQIMEQIKLRIAVGDWQPGLKLPSIRELAVATRVSVITVKRAYQELESEGVIFTQHGKGSFVAQIDNIGAQLRQEELDSHLLDAISLAKALGISAEALADRVSELFDKPASGNKKRHK